MQVLIAISGFCPRIGNVPCTTPFDFLFVISIHVPTWGTTLSISTNLFALIFQSTFPRGERHHQPGYHYLLHSFQSTFPRGERRHITRMQLTTLHFNPRSRVGNDEQAEARQWQHAISIHVPSWGTTACTSIETGVDLFQSTFPRGERRQLRKILHKTKQISIHVPSWGTTQCLANTRRMRLFQSTFPRGERRSV